MKNIAILSGKAPQPTNFFSQAILTANTFKLELSGQIGLDVETGKLVEGGVGIQTEQIFKNMEAILSELGWNFSYITKVRIFLVSMGDYKEMNDIYAQKFTSTPPARIAVAVKELPLGALVEIECCAEGNEVSVEAKNKYGI